MSQDMPSATGILEPACTVALRRLSTRDALVMARELVQMVQRQAEDWGRLEADAAQAVYRLGDLIAYLDECGDDDDDDDDD